MSNRITEFQVNKVCRWSKEIGNGRVTLLFDLDGPGIEGMKEALWLFAEQQLHVRLAWSPVMHAGMFRNKQPEHVQADDLPRLFYRVQSWERHE